MGSGQPRKLTESNLWPGSKRSNSPSTSPSVMDGIRTRASQAAAAARRAPIAERHGRYPDEFRLSNAFTNTFTRHPGIFYASLKGGIKTAMLREAYDQGDLVDRDPLLEIKDQFEEMLDEGHRDYLERMKTKREPLKDLELMARQNAILHEMEDKAVSAEVEQSL